ncbi:MAG TPA: YCF48-related protein [Terriglobia bacterium]|nr:YCF48-related protein [Terriglobia bacterium]
MKQLPKIARERLAAQELRASSRESATDAAPHLDANLVAAFIEQALGPAERTRILDHLTKCSECRAEVRLVQSIAAPDSRAAQTAPAAGHLEQSWWRWMLRWEAASGGAAAALAIVAFWVSARPVHTPRPGAQPIIARNAGASPVAPAISKSAGDELRSSSGARSAQSLMRLQAAKPTPEKKALSNGALNASLNNDVARANQIRAGRAVIDTTRPPGTAAPAPAPRGSALSAFVAPPAPTASAAAISSKVAAVPAPPTGTAVATKASQSPYEPPTIYLEAGTVNSTPANASQTVPLRRMTAVRAASVRALQPDGRWAASDEAGPGIVEKSLDGGRTWQIVTVAAGVQLRAVFALGQDIWAGGAAGSLFHSGDGGQHWSAIGVSNGSTTLSSDIVEIQFADAVHGSVRASNGERWITSDGGQHWQQVK